MRKAFIGLILFIGSWLPANSQNCNYFCNADFDSVIYGGTNSLITTALLPCWQTTAPDGIMEIWTSGFNGFTSYSGAQHMEMNANFPATLFQDITVIPGTTLSISFAHRGRGGIDSIRVSAGPVGGPYTTLGDIGDDDSAWGFHTLNYVVPNSGTSYSIRFTTLYWAFGDQGVGNMLDAVSICEVPFSPCNFICNADFDDVIYGTYPALVLNPQLPCWQSTALDNIMEIWSNGFNGIASYSGQQYMEMNANFGGTIYQNFTASPGTDLSVSFAHCGRGGIDSISVEIGPVGGPYTILGEVGDDHGDWGNYTFNYIVPNSGSNYSLRFTTTYWALGNPGVGNMLDAVTVCSITGVKEVENQISVNISPNPANNLTSIQFKNPLNEKFVLNLYDGHGKLVRKTDDIRKGNITVAKSDLKAGLYFYVLQSATKMANGKIIFLD